MKLGCPDCKKPLGRWMIPGRGFYHRCVDHGAFVSFNLLKTVKTGEDALAGIEDQPYVLSKYRVCPNCSKKMVVVAYRPKPNLMLDICKSCKDVWFDSGELERILPENSKVEVTEGGSPKEPTSSGFDSEPKETQKSHLHPLTLLGFPTEQEVKRSERFPFATIAIILMSFAISAWMFFDPEFWELYILNPTELLANSGLNMFTSVFLYSDWIHLVGNCYFLFLCGDNIEDEVGHPRLLFLFLVGNVVGSIFCSFAVIEQPILGGSAGIVSMLTYYALAFPKHRPSKTLIFHYPVRITAMNFAAPSFLFIYLFWEFFLGGLHYAAGGNGVNLLGHLGGAVIGLLFFGVVPPKKN